MAYTKQNWANFPATTSPLEAGRLNHLETQFQEAKDYTDNAVAGLNSAIMSRPTASQVTSEIDEAIETIPTNTVSLVDSLKYPVYIAHRGSPHVYPEHSIEGYRKSLEGGFSPEADVRALADGTLVCLHDATTNRTMSFSKSISSATLNEWRSATINPPTSPGAFTGTGRGTPVLFSDYLDEFGGRTVLWPEIKVDSLAEDVIQEVRSRGLQNSVVLQSFNLEVCKQVVAAGINSLYLSDSADPPTLVADGIKFVGVSSGVSNAYISSLKNVGIRVFVYTVNSWTDAQAQISRGCDGVFSDDPWEVSRENPAPVKLDLSEGFLIRDSEHLAGHSGTPAPRDGIVRSELDGLLFGPGSNTSTYNNSLRLGSFGYGTASGTIRLKVQSFSSVATDSTWIFGVYLGSQGSFEPVTEEAATSNFRLAMVRRNGTKQAYNKPTNGGSATSLGSVAGTGYLASSGVSLPMEFEVQFTTNSVRIRNLTLCDTDLYFTHTAWTGTGHYFTLAVNGGTSRMWDIRYSKG